MSSTPKKVIPAKKPVQKGAAPKSAPSKGAPQKSGASSNTANKGAVKKPVAPTKVVSKPASAAPKQKPASKPAPKKTTSEKSEKKEGGGIFSKLFGIFRKKTPKEQKPSEVISPIVENKEETQIAAAPVNETVANQIAEETIAVTSGEPEFDSEPVLQDTEPEVISEIENINTVQVDEETEEQTISENEVVNEEEVINEETVEEQPVEEISTESIQIQEKPSEQKIQETLFPVEELESENTVELETPPIESSINEPEIAATSPVEEEVGVTEEEEQPVAFNESISYATKFTPKEESEIKLSSISESPTYSSDTPETIETPITVSSHIPEIKEESLYSPTSQTDNTVQNYGRINDNIETPKAKAPEPIIQPQALNQPSKNEKKEEKKKRSGVLIFFLISSLIANGILAWLLMNKHEEVKTVVVLKDKIIKEKDDVMSDLLKLKQEYASLQTNNVELQKELEEKRAEIESLIAQAKKHKNDAFIIAKLRKETETLRSIMKHFVFEIDSLNTLNKTIVAEKNKVVDDLNSQITKTSELEKDKDKLIQTVNKGSVLKAMSVKAEGIRMRGGVKEVDVKYAGRAEKIKVSFTLGDNPIAKKGMRTIYIRIMGPNGKEITMSESDLNSISYNGTRGFYAEKTEVEYQNAEMPVEVVCGSPTGFISGKYLIDVICEGSVIGQSELLLK